MPDTNPNVVAIKRRLMDAVLQLDPEACEVLAALAELTGECFAKLDQFERPMPFEERMRLVTDEVRIAYTECKIGIKTPIVTAHRMRPRA